MTDLTPISKLSPTDLTIELLRLCGEAGPVERRILLMCITGSDKGVATPTTALQLLEDYVSRMPWEERRLQLYVARRLIVYGQRVYGRLDLSTERRQMAVESVEEKADGVVYDSIDLLQGKSDGAMLDRSMALMRDSVGELIKREML